MNMLSGWLGSGGTGGTNPSEECHGAFYYCSGERRERGEQVDVDQGAAASTGEMAVGLEGGAVEAGRAFTSDVDGNGETGIC